MAVKDLDIEIWGGILTEESPFKLEDGARLFQNVATGVDGDFAEAMQGWSFEDDGTALDSDALYLSEYGDRGSIIVHVGSSGQVSQIVFYNPDKARLV